ncbi:hypothetical protein [Psychrobacter sp. LV10R520-6]|uniref:hypothetical protein n=1 Tax=Psychrobacter sp. LV10R520-6 TaxID=1415574 RepID=UPI0024C7A8C7|nr:hypothetical protein [Psychrobacter sp. LV10R520-6]SNT69544.1 hypothetical protein SAMN04488491_0637 [Psychrobacter sp. LV10R520-6]
MNFCSWDWKAIAPFITGLIALFIFYQWRNQKRSEIMSNEAAKILVLLEEYRENLVHLDSEMMKPLKDDNTAKLEELRLIARQLCSSAISFSGLASNERTVATQIKDTVGTFYNRAKKLDKKSFQEIRENPESPILVSGFDNAIKKPKTILIYYFKYQKVRLVLRRWVSIII